MRLRLPILFAAAVLSGACLDPLPTPDGRFGTINATAISDGGAGYVMKPEAAFYDNTDLSFSTFPSDTCFVAAYVPNATVNGALQTLNAGDYLFTSVSGRVDSLVPAPGSASASTDRSAPTASRSSRATASPSRSRARRAASRRRP